MTDELFLELQVDGEPITRLEGTVRRFHPLPPEDIDRIMRAMDRDQPMKSTEGLDEVGVEHYRREYKIWRAVLHKHLADMEEDLTYAQSHRRVEVVIRAPEGSTVRATVSEPMQIMDAYEHETSFYEDEPMFKDPPEPPTGPVQRWSWWGEEAEIGKGEFAPRAPYQLPQQIEWTPKADEPDWELLVMVPAAADEEVQGTLRVQVHAPDGRSVEQEVPVHLKAEWSSSNKDLWLERGFAQIGVDLNKEG